MKQNKQMNIKDKLAHCLIEVDFGGMNTTFLDYGSVEKLIENLISQTRQEAVGAFEKAEKHGKVPFPNPYGNTIMVKRHNQVIDEMKYVFIKALSSKEK